MAGYGLMDAVQAYRDTEDRDAAKAKEAARQKVRDDANAAFTSSLDTDKAKWAMGGAEGEFTPDDSNYLRAAQARARSFASSGDFDSYMEHSARLAPIIGGIRQKALDQFGDDEAGLIKAVYPTFLDGKDITSVDTISAPGPDGKTATPRTRVVLSDGSTKFFNPGQAKELIRQSTMSPQAKLAEAKHLYEMGQIRETGDQTRQTEGVKLQGGLTLAGRKGEIEAGLEGVKQEGRLGLATVEHANRLQQIGASGAQERATKGVPSFGDTHFTLGENQTRFTLGKDGKPVVQAKGAGSTPKPADDVKDTDNLMDLLTKSGLSTSRDAITGASRPDAFTQKAAQRVKQFRASGMSLDESIAQTRKEMADKGLLK